MLGPVLEGERIRLEPPGSALVAPYLRWFADPEVTRYLLHRTPVTARGEEQWIEDAARDDARIVWAIALKAQGQPIGGIAFEKIDWRSRHGELGYLIGEREEWGKGKATEAIRLATRYAFRELGLEKAWAQVVSANEASRRALERVGYRQCGLRRRHFFEGGRWHDAWLGEILKDEWIAMEGSRP